MAESVPESLPGYLRGLNPPQRDAVLSLDGPLLVLAGAGTGKTRVLTTRIAHLLVQRKAFPGQILAVTFTNKAAAEMRGRVAAIIGETAEGMWLGTFHALAARILRRHAELAGLRSNFTILDQDDQIRLIKQLLQAEGIDDKRWPARVVHGVLGLGADGVAEAQAALRGDDVDLDGLARHAHGAPRQPCEAGGQLGERGGGELAETHEHATGEPAVAVHPREVLGRGGEGGAALGGLGRHAEPAELGDEQILEPRRDLGEGLDLRRGPPRGLRPAARRGPRRR